MKHTLIRAAVLDALESRIDGKIAFFDGRPAVFEEDEFPAVAVYITDAQSTSDYLDEDSWSATLHIEVFLAAQVPDSELDSWMESKVYPVLSDVPALEALVEKIVPQGYDYQRDDDAAAWSSADMKYSLTYYM
ncbi:phage minor tail U family protein [Brenneria populi subsp. brevivirga]|uniref:phage minor tail U family protein n=1 Tax=Brenneria populi TaxID=1505588 RepID=UPI002E186C1B|nr:phage minor tail U family protein [Brenneria populi subsp. brevivirga]